MASRADADIRDKPVTEPDSSAEYLVNQTGLITEDSVAAAFTSAHAHDLRFDHHAGAWFRWNGATWQKEETKLAFSWIRRIARDLARNSGNGKAMLAAGRAAFVSGVERFAQADRKFAITSDAWNHDLWLLGTPAGTVDLRSGVLTPARQEHHISKQTAVGPAEFENCPVWLAFLKQATGYDEQAIGFLRRWFGYALTGSTSEHAFLFVYGPGGNGKGVLLNTISGILGSYAMTAAMDTFAVSKGERASNDLAMLHGARMVMTTETEEGQAWAEARVKALTGGDPITARFMRRDFFTYTPAFKLTISGNHKPTLRNVDDAMRRRFNVVPFMNKPEQPDKTLVDRLKAEWPGILRWMINGCLEWQCHGLNPPETVTHATADYFEEQDLVMQWIEESCNQGVTQSDTMSALFRSWTDYALANGEKPGATKWFSQTLVRLGYEAVKHTPGFPKKRGFKGIGVKLAPPVDRTEPGFSR